MSRHCEECRRELWHCLEGRPQPDRLRELAIDRHVLTCSACRDILEREHALELLLASLPDPHLPTDLTARLIARLRASLEAGEALDRLLDRVDEPQVPTGLAQAVLSGLAADRARARDAEEQRLDAVLDRLPQPVPPAALSGTLLAALEPDRERRAARPRALRLQRLSAAAAALVAAAALWWIGDGSPSSTEMAGVEGGVETPSVPGPEDLEPGDLELLSYLDVLENWEMIVDEDLDVLLSSVDSVDELILDVELGVSGDGELRREAGEGVGPEDDTLEPSHG